MTVVAPSPRHRRPYWSLRWRSERGAAKTGRVSLPDATNRMDACMAAERKSRELGWLKDGTSDAQQNLVRMRQFGRTLQDEVEQYLALGIKHGKRAGEPYAATYCNHLRESASRLTAFAIDQGCRTRQDGALYLSEILRPLRDGSRLLVSWKLYEKRTQGPNGLTTRTKGVRAVLASVLGSDDQPMFSEVLLRACLPIKRAAPEREPRVQTEDELNQILRVSMQVGSRHDLVCADYALDLLTGFRRRELAWLQVRHCRINAPLARDKNKHATWIEVPARLAIDADGNALAKDPDLGPNHAKGGNKRQVLLTRVSPLAAELVEALCETRGGIEWLTSCSYRQLAWRTRQIAAKVGFDFIFKDLRTTASNHAELVMGDRAAVQLGHTRQVHDHDYKDGDFIGGVLVERPASMEASMGIEAMVRAIIARVRQHARGWGCKPRPLPAKLRLSPSTPERMQPLPPKSLKPRTPKSEAKKPEVDKLDEESVKGLEALRAKWKAKKEAQDASWPGTQHSRAAVASHHEVKVRQSPLQKSAHKRRVSVDAKPARPSQHGETNFEPMPDLGKRLPPELLHTLLQAPPMMNPKQAAEYLGMSESRVRALRRTGQIVGIGGAMKGSKRCSIPRSAVIAYWERRYQEAALAQQHIDRP